MRALVTGGNGFVGRHLCAALRERGDEVVVAGRPHASGVVDLELDLRDFDNVCAVVAAANADVVFHLAAIAFVPEGNNDPLTTYDVNVLGTARVFEAIRRSPRPVRRALFVGSAEIYGSRPASAYPLRETSAPQPTTPYAASKTAGEAIALAAFRTFGIPALMTRAFNHIGPGQDDRFALSSFAKQLAEIKNGAPPLMYVGNLEAQRDFLDVRDVVRAYALLAERGVDGEAYNVCSGRAVTIKEVLRRLITIAGVAVEVREDPERMRPSDNPLSLGDNAKLREATGWEPTISLDASLRTVYEAAVAGVGAHA
ncbi:MAG: GDP-mannose 4,6-dehydratase [Candidatus Eremiobacteraeota bacterium]|nr:GDP-mannose 4,6-dehydratase [Candidatus Eremiobacteraeota bacterium]